MATSAASPRTLPRAAALARPGVLVPLGLGLLAALSVVLRVGVIDSGLWVDEGLSVGIADRPLLDIPGVLRQDGSPPLYYMLLHVWIEATGRSSESALHALSLLFAVATVPVANAFARTLIGARAGWIAAILFATNPFLTQYAQEARMYSLVVLLSLTACATFAGAFALRRTRRWTVGFALAQTALLYTHNWGLFLAAGLAAGFAALLWRSDDRPRLLREGLLAAAIVVVAYAPWLPTLVFQALNTGAPWARPTDLEVLREAPSEVLGGIAQYVLLLGAGAGLAVLARRRTGESGAALALGVAAVFVITVPWLISTFSPAFATRYLAVAVGPLLLVATLGLGRAGRLALPALALVVALWATNAPPESKSNVSAVAAGVGPSLRPDDLVLSTQPEQVPVLAYYLDGVAGLRYATLTGAVPDRGVTDWRDGVARLEATSVENDLEPLLGAVRPGERVALVTPDFSIASRWKAPWTRVIRARSLAWEDRMRRDPRFRVIAVEPPIAVARPHEVRATIFVRQPLDSRAQAAQPRRAPAPSR